MADEKLLKEIGARINKRRKEMLMTQEQLAEAMDVSIQMISNLELGKKAIRPENIVKLCNVLNVSADYILRGTKAEWEQEELMRRFCMLPSEKQALIESILETWL